MRHFGFTNFSWRQSNPFQHLPACKICFAADQILLSTMLLKSASKDMESMKGDVEEALDTDPLIRKRPEQVQAEAVHSSYLQSAHLYLDSCHNCMDLALDIANVCCTVTILKFFRLCVSIGVLIYTCVIGYYIVYYFWHGVVLPKMMDIFFKL